MGPLVSSRLRRRQVGNNLSDTRGELGCWMSLELVCIQQQQCFVDMGIVGLSVDTERERVHSRYEENRPWPAAGRHLLQISTDCFLSAAVFSCGPTHTAIPTTRLFTAEDFLLLLPCGPVNLLFSLRFNLHPPRLLLLFSSFSTSFPSLANRVAQPTC